MKPKKILIIITLLFIFCYSSFTVFNVYADYKIEVSIPGGTQTNTSVDLSGYIKNLYVFGLALVVISALGALVLGGFMYMLPSGTITTQEEAKKYIWGAISGLILALAAYLILYTINPDLVNLNKPDLEEIPAYEASPY